MAADRLATEIERAPTSPEGLDHALRLVPRLAWLAWTGAVALLAGALLWGWFGTVLIETKGEGLLLSGSLRRILAPASGVIESNARAGQTLRAGEPLATVRTADAQVETAIVETDGFVVETYVERGWTVQRGDVLANFESSEYRLRASVFVPLEASIRIRPGMLSHLSLGGTSSTGSGLLVGKVVQVSRFPVSPRRLMALFENASLVESFGRQGPIREVTIELERDPSQPGGYRWTTGRAPPFDVAAGMKVQAEIVLGQQRPLALLLP